MKAADFIRPRDVILDLPASSKARFVALIAERAGVALGLAAGVVSDALLLREGLGSTGIGDGVAIPHAPIPGLSTPVAWLIRLRKPIEFESVDGRPVDVVLVLLTPGNGSKPHLDVLACFARRLRSQQVLAEMRAAKSSAELYAAFVHDPAGTRRTGPA